MPSSVAIDLPPSPSQILSSTLNHNRSKKKAEFSLEKRDEMNTGENKSNPEDTLNSLANIQDTATEFCISP